MTDSKQKIPTELQPKVAALSRAIFMRDCDSAASLYREILTAKPDYLLRPPVQYDLARLLELGGNTDLAFQAYQIIIERQPENSAYAPALKSAGHLAHKLEKYDACLEYLEAFLETNPATPDRQDAEEVLSRLPPTTKRKSRSEKEPKSDPPSEIPSSGSWMTTDSGRPVTFEWSVPGKSSEAVRLPKNLSDTPNPSDAQKKYEFESSSPDESLKPFRGSEQSIKLDSDIHEKMGREISSGAVFDPRRQSRQSKDEGAAKPPRESRDSNDEGFGSISGGPVPALAPKERQKSAGDTSQTVAHAYSVPKPEPQPVPRSERKKVRVFGARRSISEPAESASGIFEPDDEETPEQRYDRLRDGQFALLLPVGKRIHLDAVAQLASAREGIGESQAKKLVLKRKGILYDKLTLSDVLELHPLVAKCRQALVFVNVPRNLRPYEHYDVLSAQPKEPGLKMTTDAAVRRIRWKDIRLINAGNVAGEIVVSIVGSDPMKEYRFFESEFDYKTFSPGNTKSFREGLIEFLGVIASNATKSVRSHTVENMLKAKVREPQVFAIHEEYDYYTNWMLFSHYGEPVDSAELVEQSKVTSNW